MFGPVMNPMAYGVLQSRRSQSASSPRSCWVSASTKPPCALGTSAAQSVTPPELRNARPSLDGPNVQRMVRFGILHSLSATHIVGQSEFLELALTRDPARPGCVIEQCVSSVAEYIKAHPPYA